MNKTAIMTSLSNKAHRIGFQLKKHSPEILVVAGVVGTVVSTVVACKATTKVGLILEETKETLDVIHGGVETGAINGKAYEPEDGKKDTVAVYAQTSVKLVKLYAPAVVIGATSLGCILTSNNILCKRNVALAAAYTAVDKGFKEYRSRVVERFGETVDRELRYNIKAKKFEETVVGEDGKEKKVKTTVQVTELGEHSDYARFFDESSTAWEKSPEHNLMFLRAEQNYANDVLVARGRLFLNDVYERLGIPKTKAGQVVGWIYDTENPKGDNYVDFGIYDGHREVKRDFVNGYERSILLDFNVDGVIIDDSRTFDEG